MVAYAITAWAAINAAGASTARVADAVIRRAAAVAPCVELSQTVGWMGALQPSPRVPARHDRRAVRIVAHALAEIDPVVTAARARWGASRIGVLVAFDPAADDALVTAVRAGDLLPMPTPDPLVAAAANMTEARGPVYARLDEHGTGLATLGAAMGLVAADVVDAVVVLGVQALGHGAAFGAGEGAAAIVLERRADTWIEAFDPKHHRGSAWRSDLAYRHAENESGRDSALTLAPITGTLGPAAGLTAFVLAAWALHHDRSPVTGEALAAEHVEVREAGAAFVLRARDA